MKSIVKVGILFLALLGGEKQTVHADEETAEYGVDVVRTYQRSD